MKKTQIAELGHMVNKEPSDEITFQNIESDSNIFKAQVTKDGKKHAVYLLTIPEDNFDSFRETQFIQVDVPLEQEVEYSDI